MTDSIRVFTPAPNTFVYVVIPYFDPRPDRIDELTAIVRSLTNVDLDRSLTRMTGDPSRETVRQFLMGAVLGLPTIAKSTHVSLIPFPFSGTVLPGSITGGFSMMGEPPSDDWSEMFLLQSSPQLMDRMTRFAHEDNQ